MELELILLSLLFPGPVMPLYVNKHARSTAIDALRDKDIYSTFPRGYAQHFPVWSIPVASSHPPGSRAPAGEKRERDDVQRRIMWSRVKIRGKECELGVCVALWSKGRIAFQMRAFLGLRSECRFVDLRYPTSVHLLGFLHDAVPNKQALISIGNICSISCSSRNNALRERLR